MAEKSRDYFFCKPLSEEDMPMKQEGLKGVTHCSMDRRTSVCVAR